MMKLVRNDAVKSSVKKEKSPISRSYQVPSEFIHNMSNSQGDGETGGHISKCSEENAKQVSKSHAIGTMIFRAPRY
jgi:hypothetical protein